MTGLRLVAVLIALVPLETGARQPDSEPPPLPREFRAAWVATVENIDWPSRRDLTVEQQQQELIAIVDKAAELKLNALIVQVRTSADSLYVSKLEPWSIYLTGQSGRAPEPLYDPLQMWIEEAHRRGIELHAWFNPYRARVDQYECAGSHISRARPDLVREYGKYLWLDPGEPDAAAHSLSVFRDVLARYDVDGVHIDDYFYPYPIKADETEVPFPDDASWSKYQASGGLLNRDDWRRDNVNRLIEGIYLATRELRPHAKFGISPFGIGRPGRAPEIEGFDQYSKLYADAELWLHNGWCDYFTPQLYWPVDQRPQTFPILLDYWTGENRQARHLWPGLFTSRVGDPRRPFPPGEVPRQIEVTRAKSASPGHLHFSMKALMQNREGLADELKAGLYSQPAVVPASPWLDATPPRPPISRVTREKATRVVRLSSRPGEPVWLFAIRLRQKRAWELLVHPGPQSQVQFPEDCDEIVVSAIDRCGNESPGHTVIAPR
jgi:uncharacterized lipoprotein YddW (UPF0748 family)